ncbi:MAG TPA: CHASE domain-containing protein [Macromonas sp.]|nr:CHASE domain-containing protein [Macromonas sp.]
MAEPAAPSIENSSDTPSLHDDPGGAVPRAYPSTTAFVVLFVSLIVTLLSWWAAVNHVRQRAQDRFLLEAQQAEAAIVRRMQEYEQVLRSGVGLFMSSDEVTRADWHHFVTTLDLGAYWPGLQGLGYAEMVQAADMPTFVARVRRDGFPDFDIHPPGERALYSSIVYLEPFDDRNQRAFGFDMHTEGTRRAAMDRARDTGQPALSGPVTLVQEDGQNEQTGFLMYMPFYRSAQAPTTPAERQQALAGFVFSPFRTKDLMAGILGQGSPYFDFRIFDGGEVNETALIYATPGFQRQHIPDSRFSTVRRLQLPGRTWAVQFVSSPVLEREVSNTQPLIVAIGGLAVDFLLFFIIWSLSLSRQRAAAWARQQSQLMFKLQLSDTAFRYAREAILVTDARGNILDVNPMFETLTGYSKAEVRGQNPRMFSAGMHDNAFYRNLWETLLSVGHWEGEIWNHRKNGEVFAEALNISTVRDEKGEILHFIALFSDITDLKRQQHLLEHMAHFDALTGLPNRVLLGDRLKQAMAQTLRRDLKLAVVYLDLDGFKAVNDDLGHEAGDRLLVQTAEHMKVVLREGDTLARLGGDEFVAVLLDLPDVEACVPLVVRLLSAAHQEVQVQGVIRRVSASLGVTFYPQPDEVDADQLLRQADQAMYQAKLAGKNRYHIFDMEQDRAVRGHHESLERIRSALQQGEFVLHYQPIVNMRTGTVVGVEALVRWQHPQRGLLLPEVFLPVLEGHELSIDLDRWVLGDALKQCHAWHRAGHALRLSVNVGTVSVFQPEFTHELAQLLKQFPDLPRHVLELEIQEANALEDIRRISEVMQSCLQLGVTFALDDFGTGYSSLTYFKRLQARTLKVDRSFVHDMLEDLDDLAILEGVLGLARAFSRETVAEGVESVEQGDTLLDLGCDIAQGHAIAHPMPASDLPGWKAGWQAPASWLNRPQRATRTLPLVFAMVEHRNWLLSLENHLRDTGPPPLLNSAACRFGRWLRHEGREELGHLPVHAELHGLHEAMHLLAQQLLELKAQDQVPQALERLPELRQLIDALQARLRALP